MKQGLIYLLSILLLLSMGGAFHHHDGQVYSLSSKDSVFIDSHHCNTPGKHPDLPDQNYCQDCSRIVTSSIFDSLISEIGDIEIINEVLREQHTLYTTDEYLNKSEPRSPPQIF